MTLVYGLGLNSSEPIMIHMMCLMSSELKYKMKMGKKNQKVRSDHGGEFEN